MPYVRDGGRAIESPPHGQLPKIILLLIGLGWLIVAAHISGGVPRLLFEMHSLASIPPEVTREGISSAALLSVFLGVLKLTYFFGTALSAGAVFLNWLRPLGMNLFEEVVFSLGLGLGFLSILTLIAGLLGAYSPTILIWSFAIIAATSIVVHATRSRHERVAGPMRAEILRVGPLEGLATSLILFLVFLNLLGAMGPTIFYDALEYHLALPKLYLLHRKIFPTPHNIYSGIPFNIEMLYGLALAVGGELLAKVIPWGLSLLLLACLAMWNLRYGSVRTCLMGTLLFISSPVVCSQVWHAFVELGWAFFAFLSCYALIVAFDYDERRGWLVLSAIFCGFAMGVKYNAFVTVVILEVVFVMTVLREGKGHVGLRPIFLLWTLPLMLVAPWLLKNWWFYANPIFPFLQEKFSSHYVVDWRGLVQDAKARDLLTSVGSLMGMKELFFGLWSPGWGNEDNLGIGFLAFSPVLLVTTPKVAASQRAFLILCLCWLSWSMSTAMPRFFVFGLPLLAILIAEGIGEQTSRPKVQLGLFILVLIAAFSSSIEVLANWHDLMGWRVVFGQQSKSDYLKHTQIVYPSPYYAGVEFINNHAPANAKVLFIHEARGYYCERDFIASSIFGRSPILDLADKSRNVQELRSQLRGLGITHVMVNFAETVRVGRLPGFGEFAKSPTVAQLLKSLPKVFEYKSADPKDFSWVTVYEIK